MSNKENKTVRIETLIEDDLKNVTLSDVNIIRALIKGRSKLDRFYNLKQNYNPYEAGIIEKWNEDLLCLYIDLDNLINKIKLSTKQINIITNLMNGYLVKEIAEEYGEKDTSNIEHILDTICLKLKKQNDEDWVDIIRLNYIKTKDNYKQCTKCNNFFAINDYNFSRDNRNKDGFQSNCKKCDNSRKQNT